MKRLIPLLAFLLVSFNPLPAYPTQIVFGTHKLRIAPEYVTEDPQAVSVYPSIDAALGIGAHRHLAGNYFAEIEVGDTITVNYSNWTSQAYTVKEIHLYKQIDVRDDYSGYWEYTPTGKIEYTFSALLYELLRDDRLVLMTCHTYDGAYWGKLVVIAERNT